MDALLKEIEEMEKQEAAPEEVAAPEAETQEAEQEVVKEEVAEAPKEVAESEEDKVKIAQEKYRERQRTKKEEAERKAKEAQDAQDAKVKREAILREQAEAETTTEQDALQKKLAQVDQIIQRDRINTWLSNAETELEALEGEFKVAFTDYDDLVSTAMDITLDRMVSGGMSKKQAQEALRIEKLKIADAAAAKGLDPVEAVYKEAKAINTWFETYAQKLGYQKTGTKANQEKSITQKAALREASKPSAMTGGKNAGALKLSFDEMDNVDDISIGDMMSGKY
jgi:hypothetical protein